MSTMWRGNIQSFHLRDSRGKFLVRYTTSNITGDSSYRDQLGFSGLCIQVFNIGQLFFKRRKTGVIIKLTAVIGQQCLDNAPFGSVLR